MKVAVLADVHSNLLALNQILEDSFKNGVEKNIFLGDYITDGPFNDEVLNIVRQRGDYIVQGNRERYIINYDESRKSFSNYKPISFVYANLDDKNKAYIKSLDKELIIEIDGVKLLLIHGDEISSYVQEFDWCDNLEKKYDYDICLYGHTHCFKYFEHNNRKYLNPGSCGQPCDGPNYSYVILNIVNGNIDVKRRTFKVSDTFEKLKEDYIRSKYYLENTMWCEIILRILETGIDHCTLFMNELNEEIKDNKEMECDEFNKAFIIAHKRWRTNKY